MNLTFNDIILYLTLFFSTFLTLFFLLSYLENSGKDLKRKSKKYPKISVIIPAFNESGNITKSIKSVLNVDYPREKLEIIVVDDGSKDDTFEQAKKNEGKTIKIFKKNHSGKAETVNYGVKKSGGELVMVLDADTFPDKECFKNIIDYFDDPKIMAALPLIKIWKPKNLIERCQAMEYTITALTKKTFFFMGSMNCTPAGAFIRKSFIEKYGGFSSETLTEDFEMGMRIQSKNYQIAQSIKSKVYTIVPNGIKKLIRQRIRWSHGTLDNIFKYRYMINSKYGDLGVFFLPISLLNIGLVSFLFLYFSIKLVVEFFHKAYLNSLINFDIIPLINFNGRISLTSLITDEKTFLILFSFLTAFILYEISRRSVEEKFRIEYVFYLLIYGWVMSLSQLIALFYFVTGKKPKW